MAKNKPASGMYKTKARNLTDAQLKRSKGLSASTKRTVAVKDTRRETETGANKGYTLSASGKRLTGTVVMANGDRAVYKGGKRVTNVPKAVKNNSNGGGDNGNSGRAKPLGTTPAQKLIAMAKDKQNSVNRGSTSTPSSPKPPVVNKYSRKESSSEGPKYSRSDVLSPYFKSGQKKYTNRPKIGVASRAVRNKNGTYTWVPIAKVKGR